MGQGLYGLGELERFLALEGKPQEGARALYWLSHALNPIPHRARQPDYSFSDLVSLFVVRELRRRGVPNGEIAEAERYGRDRFGVDRPFVRYDVATDGRDICFEADRDSSKPHSVEAANRRGQRVLVEPIRDQLRSVRYSEGTDRLAVAWTPAEGIVLNPSIQFGAPVIEGTRVLVDHAVDLAEELGQAEAVERLSLDRRQLRAALSFQRRLAAALA